MKKSKLLISGLITLSLFGCGNIESTSSYKKGDIINVIEANIEGRKSFKDEEEFITLKESDKYETGKDIILVFNKEKEEAKVLEKAEKGFVIGYVELIDDLLIWEEYEEKESNIKYKIKCRKLDSDEVIVVKETKRENINYGEARDICYNGKDIAYRIVEFDKEIIERYTLDTKQRKVESSLKRAGNLDENDKLQWGLFTSSVHMDKENISFVENTTDGSKLYHYKFGEQPKVIKTLDECTVMEVRLQGECVYLNCVDRSEGVKHIKRVNIKTLKEQELFTKQNLEDIEAKDGKEDDKTIKLASNFVYFKSITDEVVEIKIDTGITTMETNIFIDLEKFKE